MKCHLVSIIFLMLLLLIATVFVETFAKQDIETVFPEILFYEVNLANSNLHFYSTNKTGEYFINHRNLKNWLAKKKQKLVFAMNGGMYNKNLSPQGLYIENGVGKAAIDTLNKGYGNFYLKPNGIFFINKNNEAKVVVTEEFKRYNNVKYATQSGPMLLINGEFHPKFNKNSKNVHIRNGVGILANGNILFAMSKEKVTFYRLAQFFKKAGCNNALYLDGFVSKTYLPKKEWIQEDGVYGIIIAEIEKLTGNE